MTVGNIREHTSRIGECGGGRPRKRGVEFSDRNRPAPSAKSSRDAPVVCVTAGPRLERSRNQQPGARCGLSLAIQCHPVDRSAKERVNKSRTTQKPQNPQRKMLKAFLRVLRVLRSTSYSSRTRKHSLRAVVPSWLHLVE